MSIMGQRLDASGSDVEARLCAALVELLREKPLTDISVKELCMRAYVARSTFYLHFRNVDDVLERVEHEVVASLSAINEPLANRALSAPAELDFLHGTLVYFEEQRELMRVLLITRPNARFTAAWKAAIKEHLAARWPLGALRAEDDFALDMAASTMVNAATYLLEHDAGLSEEFVRAVVADVLAMLAKGR